MSFEEFSEKLMGEWKGEYMLQISPNHPQMKCDSTAKINRIVMNSFLQIDYTWEFEGKQQQGLLVAGYTKSNKKIQMSWVDSWHQQNEFMVSKGIMDSDSSIDAKGDYEVSDGPNWGWRTKIISKSKVSFLFEMYNITPEGLEHLGVQVEYSKISN